MFSKNLLCIVWGFKVFVKPQFILDLLNLLLTVQVKEFNHEKSHDDLGEIDCFKSILQLVSML